MDFKTAARRCRTGQYFKPIHGGWSENYVQYGRDSDGNLFWTAGCTAGGPLDLNQNHPRHVLAADYAIYDSFHARNPSAI